MHVRHFTALLRKEILDGTRLSWIYIVLAVPLLFGAFARVQDQPEATIAFAGPEETALIDAMRTIAEDGALEMHFRHASDATEVRRLVEDHQVDIGLVLSPGFDDALRAGDRPEFTIIQREARELRDLRRETAVTAAELALHLLAQNDPARTTREIIPAPGTLTMEVFQELGPGRFAGISMLAMFVVFIGLFFVPQSLTEESERKTLDALLLVTSRGQVIATKAVFALLVTAVGLPLFIGVSGLVPRDPVTYIAAKGLLAVTVIGIGLLVGILSRSQRDSPWGTLVAMPLIASAVAAGLPVADRIQGLLTFIPTSQAARLAVNGMTGRTLFPDPWLGFLVIIAWGAIAYGLLFWRLARREG